VSHSYYIYYRVAASPAQVQTTASSMQAALEQETGVQGRLLRRLEDEATWMEVYEDIADPSIFERQLEVLVERFGVRRLLAPDAERHVERFVCP
jgi:Domain of unknown function (DUF4936)